MRTSTYFNKLMKIIDGSGYECLMKTLFNIDFYSDMPLDKNLMERVMDFRNEIGYFSNMHSEVSVFEVLIIMAMDIERNIMHRTEAGNRTGEWYWAMMRNLHLEYFDDEQFDDLCAECVYTNIDILLERQYNPDGSDGGLFSVDEPRQDMRKVPLWTQACWWLSEKYADELRIEWV